MSINYKLYSKRFVNTLQSYKLFGHPHPLLKPQALICSCTLPLLLHPWSHHCFLSSGKAFYKIVDYAFGNLCPFSQKSISEVKRQCWMTRPAIGIPMVLIMVEVRSHCSPFEFHHNELIKLCLFGVGFVHRSTSLLDQKRTFPQTVAVATRSETHKSLTENT